MTGKQMYVSAGAAEAAPLGYEPALRALGQLIDDEGWHDVVVVETEHGLLLKGLCAEPDGFGAGIRVMSRLISSVELGHNATRGAARRAAPTASPPRRIWPWS